jgi:hypothetical protein
LRPLRARSLSEEDASLVKRFDESSLSSLRDSIDQTDVNELPLVRELSLNDSGEDADNENFVEDTTTDLDVPVRRSSYSQDENKWQSLPPEADSALRTLQAEFTNAEDAIGPERYLTNLLPNIYAEDGQGVSREILNDVYFLAKAQIARTIDNPLFKDDQLSDAAKLRIQRMIELVKAIDKMDSRAAFLVPENAQVYNDYLLESTNLGATSLTTHEREILRSYGSSLADVSFNRIRENSEVHKTITDYRKSTLDRLTTDLGVLESIFQDKLIKKEHHNRVLQAQSALRQAVDRVKPLLDNPSDPNTTDAIEQLNLAITAMKTAAQTYLSSDRKNKKRIQSRLDACQTVLDRLDQLTVKDDKIIDNRLAECFRVIEAARRFLNPVSRDAFDKAVEGLVFDDTGENVRSILDNIAPAIEYAERRKEDLFKGDPNKDITSTNESIAAGVSGAGAVTAFLLTDLYKAFSFIKGIKKRVQDSEPITPQDALKGTSILTSGVQNTSTAFKSGVTVAGAISKTAVSEGLKAAADMAGTVATAAGIVLSTGGALIAGRRAYKTNLRVESAKGIEDDSIRTQIVDRIQTKKRRALLTTLGCTIGIAGGIVAIVGTAGLAAPIVAGVAAVIGLSLASNRGIRAAIKTSKGTRGSEREALATEIFKHMNDLLASGNYDKAKELAQALTNNKVKQNLMLRGADAGADFKYQQAALVIMRDKLKTW